VVHSVLKYKLKAETIVLNIDCSILLQISSFYLGFYKDDHRHQFHFSDVITVFDVFSHEERKDEEQKYDSYGFYEERFDAVEAAMIEGRSVIIFLTYTMVSNIIRIISARKVENRGIENFVYNPNVWMKRKEVMKDMLINQQLSTLLTLILSESWHPKDRAQITKRQSVEKVRLFIEENYREKITLDNLASRFYIDKFYLGKSFKDQFELTITIYLQNIRITKAKQMLRFTDKTVEIIADEVGFGAPDYFSRVFKKVEGLSPKQYRNQW